MFGDFVKIPKHPAGFTLAELLISLAILGVIATFTIPKILSTQQNGQYKAEAKEVAGTLAAAYEQFKQSGQVSASSQSKDLTPYLNYIAYDTSSTIDWAQTQTTLTCSGTSPCLKMHNGAMLYFLELSFAGTNNNNAIWVLMDPDGKVTDSTTNGPGKGLWFAIYYSGRITTYSNLIPGTISSDGPRNPNPIFDPPWFNDWN